LARLQARRLYLRLEKSHNIRPGNHAKGAWLTLHSAIVNVMTRDTQGLHGDRDSTSEAEVYTALWSAASFPRLPADAPNELRKLTIEVDDPKRVYVIHRASRRHHLQNLVEKFVPRPLHVSNLLTVTIGIPSKLDMAANPVPALHRHASLVASGLQLVSVHRCADTMRRVREPWRYTYLLRITPNKVFAIIRAPRYLSLLLRMFRRNLQRKVPPRLMGKIAPLGVGSKARVK
jgi:hypothetical protein